MTHEQAPTEAAVSQQAMQEESQSQDRLSGANTRLHGFWLLLARAVWLTALGLALTLLVISIPVGYNDLLDFQLINSLFGDNSQASRSAVQHGLQQLGISAGFYAAYNIALEIVVALGFLTTAILIFWRKSNDLMAIAVSFTLVTFGPQLMSTLSSLVVVQPEWGAAYTVLGIGWVAFGLIFFALFPDGKLVPRWMLGWAVVWVVYTLSWVVIPADSPLNPGKWPTALLAIVTGGLLAVGAYAQVYRYRWVSGPARRHQTKWIVFGLVLASIGITASNSLASLLPPPGQSDASRVLYGLIIVAVTYFCYLCLPLAIGFSVLRYRLYDIDIIINRTLVYVPLTAILAGLYAASIASLQKLFIATTGEKSDAAIVITTLLLTTTFTPIKNRLQSSVDKRFKEASDANKKLKVFDQQVKSVEEVLDTEQIVKRLLEEAKQVFDIESGAVYLNQNGVMQMVHAHDKWDGDAKLSLPLESHGEQLGLLQLGARKDGRDYSPEDQQILRQVVNRVAHVVHLAKRA